MTTQLTPVICIKCKDRLPKVSTTHLNNAVVLHFTRRHPEVVVNVDRRQLSYQAESKS